MRLKFSEAIALGRVLTPELRKYRFAGCANGMALRAVGKLLVGSEDWCDQGNWSVLHRQWPWLRKIHTAPPLVCASATCSSVSSTHLVTYGSLVAHVFDSHVMQEECTLEQLIDQVRAWERVHDCEATDQVEGQEVAGGGVHQLREVAGEVAILAPVSEVRGD